MLNGLDESQIKALQESLDGLPPFFDEVKASILLGCGYWYPLSGTKPEMNAAAYSIDRVYQDGRIDLLKKVLEEAGIHEATGYHPYCFDGQAKWKHISDMQSFLFEQDGAGYIFPWTLEIYYYNGNEAWIIYVSHEGTITFAGEQLAQIAEKSIPDRYQY